MCGISGFVDRGLSGMDSMRAEVTAMSATLLRRGPDSGGIWIDPQAGVALGHRRLAIVDVTTEGHQPMVSASGRYVITFNGEIYNFEDLRSELDVAGSRFRGHSDTEVMLAAIEAWGIRAALLRFTGMFAFALWDRRERRLTLARDRLGEKPLYYGVSKGVFLFGSQLKALQAHSAWEGEIDREAIALFLRHNCVPAPRSIYSGFRKLVAGRMLHLDANGIQREETYWNPMEEALAALGDPFQGSEDAAVEAVESTLRGIIKRQMVANVPLGAFLSGGIDSSLVVALMQQQSSAPIRTFTLGFDAEGYDESEHARIVAKSLGTQHTELRVGAEDALRMIPELPAMYDEPFADSSQVPTALVAKLTRNHVTVSLSGDGADELFSGYDRYDWGESLIRRMNYMPQAFRRAAAGALIRLPMPTLETTATLLNACRKRFALSGDRLRKIAFMIDARSDWDLYGRLISHWGEPGEILLDAPKVESSFACQANWLAGQSFRARMMFADQVGYLPGDILAKLDRASMWVGLESRCPFLDHELLRLSWRLPMSMKHRGREGKWILRRILDRHLPQGLFSRPKMGFRFPLRQWLRGPLREWGGDLLDASALRNQGFFDPGPIARKWEEHLSGKRNWYYQLWDVLMFQSWLKSQSATKRAPRPSEAGLQVAMAGEFQ
jgi:asparagine synthase (glutamine-hydrolysing)